MTPSFLRSRIKAYQKAHGIETFGQAVDAFAAELPRHRSAVYRYLKGEQGIDPVVEARIRAISLDMVKCCKTSSC